MDSRERLRRNADDKAMDLRSSREVFRRRQRIKFLIWVVLIAAAVRYLPWRQWSSEAMSHLGVELTDPDAGAR